MLIFTLVLRTHYIVNGLHKAVLCQSILSLVSSSPEAIREEVVFSALAVRDVQTEPEDPRKKIA